MAKKLDSKIAEKVMLKAGLKPLEPYKMAKAPWKCKCIKCGKVTFPSYSNTKNGSGCAYCNKFLTSPEDAEKRMREVGLQPLEPFKSGRTKWKCLCTSCGSVVTPQLHDIRRGSSGCKKCGKKKQAKATKYSDKEATAIMNKAKLDPIEPYRRSDLKFTSKCRVCKSIVSPTLSSVLAGSGCKVCAGKAFGIATKLNEEVAVSRMLKSGLKPLESYVHSGVGWKSQCLTCGSIVYPHLTSISKGGGCQYCAKAGIQMLKPSYLYLISNKNLNAHKIGIGNQRKSRDRIKKFINKGWSVHKVWEIDTGAKALKVEKKIFKIIRHELKFPIYLSSDEMPVTGGETETVDADSITLLELEKLVKRVLKEYSK